MARAFGSYPTGRWFKSDFRYQESLPIGGLVLRPVGQAVKTRPFHGCNMGSIPVRVTKRKETHSVRLFLFAAPVPQAARRRKSKLYLVPSLHRRMSSYTPPPRCSFAPANRFRVVNPCTKHYLSPRHPVIEPTFGVAPNVATKDQETPMPFHS